MRTTLTLDSDVSAALEKLGRDRRQTFKSLVNDALRRGIRQMTEKPATRGRVKIRPMSLGRCRLQNLDSLSEVLAFAEGEDFK